MVWILEIFVAACIYSTQIELKLNRWFCDIVVLKTTDERERYGEKGEVMSYHRNIYLHFLTKCLKQHHSNFPFEEIAVTKNTQDSSLFFVKSLLEAKWGHIWMIRSRICRETISHYIIVLGKFLVEDLLLQFSEPTEVLCF